jgi:hypothetical protein
VLCRLLPDPLRDALLARVASFCALLAELLLCDVPATFSLLGGVALPDTVKHYTEKRNARGGVALPDTARREVSACCLIFLQMCYSASGCMTGVW